MRLVKINELTVGPTPIHLPALYDYERQMCVVLQTASGTAYYGNTDAQLIKLAAGASISLPETKSESIWLRADDSAQVIVAVFA